MDDATGNPAPMLPPTGAAPAAASATTTGFSPPVGPATDIPAPSPTRPLVAPSLPEFTTPTLPPAGAPPKPAPGTNAESDTRPDTEPVRTAASEVPQAVSPKRGSSLGKVFLPLLLVAGVGAAGYIGYTNLSDSGTDDADGAVEAPAVSIRPAATSPLVAPIEDAKAVVEQINENTEEQVALDELGLGQPDAPDLTVGAGIAVLTGDVIADDLVTAVGAPTFKYQFARGSAAAQSVWVDSSSGNRESFDGTTYVRVVDGVAYSSVDPAAAWRADPDAAPTDPLALGGDMITLDAVLPATLLDAASASSLQGESGSGTYLFVDTELAAATPDARTAFLTMWGLDWAAAPVATDVPVDGVPAAATPGMILVSVVSSADGVVTSLSIDAPGLGEPVSYRLLAASMDPLDIGVPSDIIE